MWVSHRYIPSMLNFSPTPPHPTPLGRHRALSWAACAVRQLPARSLLYIRQCCFLSLPHPLLPLPCPKFVLYVFVSIAAAAAAKSLQSCLTLWDAIDGSPPGSSVLGIPTGEGCHFLLQCMKVKSESEVSQSCPTLSYPTNNFISTILLDSTYMC